MSRETQEWLENNIRVGFTEERGNAWWYQGDDQSHYEGAIPTEVARKTLDVPVGLYPVYVGTGTKNVGNHRVPGRRAVVHLETNEVFYIGTDDYTIHNYPEWLIDKTELAADEKLPIGGVGVLQGGARAYIQFEHPGNREHNGEKYRPFIVVTSSLDGSIKTTWKLGITRVVCDNTLDMFMGEAGSSIGVPHSEGAELNIPQAKEALALLSTAGDAFDRELDKFLSVDVTTKKWNEFLEAYAPIKPEDHTSDDRGSKLRVTKAENIRGDLQQLYTHDIRVAPWTGTAWGVLQAVNTYNQHMRTVKTTAGSRAERNLINFFDGRSADQDRTTMKKMSEVGILPPELVTV